MQELAPERRAVREAIESLRLTPVMFELGARPHPPRALYRAYLEQSDVFVGLYWESYGWVPPGEELSGLEDEYRLSGDRPKLIYLKTPAPERQPRLDELIARIQRYDSVSYRPFGTADELRTLVADDLAVLLTERFAATTEVPADTHRSTHIAPLPRPVTRLIGRDPDVALVLDLLVDPDVRMVTIVGPGGISKSRLALAVAEGARERCPDGISYIDLAPLTEPSLVLPTIAKSLGIEEQTGTSVGTQLRGRLAEARMMIVLDNMEQLAEAASDVSDLLEATQALVLLVTSRRLLDVRGAAPCLTTRRRGQRAADGPSARQLLVYQRQLRRRTQLDGAGRWTPERAAVRAGDGVDDRRNPGLHAGRFRGDRQPPGRGPAPRRRGRGQAHRGVRPVTAGDRTGRRVSMTGSGRTR